MFLLTDCTPLLTDTIQLGRPPWITLQWGGVRLSCLNRITLTIDPLTTPREVAQQYASIRAKLLSRNPRSQSLKHLQLAVFAVKHPVLDQEAMVEWGAQFPRWKYTRFSLFARDARTARARLLHEHPADPIGFGLVVPKL